MQLHAISTELKHDQLASWPRSTTSKTNMKTNLKLALAATVVSIFTACGGGGGGDDYSNLTCSNFGTRAAAQDAYNKGAKQLDGDGDGIACENLK